MPANEYLFKICTIGSANTPKTQVIRRYAENKFDNNYMPTLGVDITTKKITINNNNIKLILVDTAGQEFFGKLRPSYYRGANACIIFFLIEDKQSIETIPSWLAEFRKYVPSEDVPIMLLGIKNFLQENEKVPRLSDKNVVHLKKGKLSSILHFILRSRLKFGFKKTKLHKQKNKASESIKGSLKEASQFAYLHGMEYCEVDWKNPSYSQVLENCVIQLSKKFLELNH